MNWRELAGTTGIVIVILAFVLVWLWTVLRTVRYLTRRRLPALEVAYWLALVLAFPLIGYLIFRIGSAIEGELLPAAATSDRSTGSVPAQSIPRRPSGPSSGCWLTVTEGPLRGQRFWLETFPAVIGRGAEAALRLEQDGAVSRKHAELFLRDGALYLRDLGSRHGTLVNGTSVMERPLVNGDRISVGASTFVVQGGE